MNRRSKMKKLIAALLLVGSSTAMAYDNYMGQIIGGVAGGIIGNQVGGGSGKVVTTAIGASVGAIVGGRVQDNMNYNRSGYGYNGYSSYENYDYNQSRRYNHPRIIYQQPQTQYQTCSAWTETVDQYGVTTRSRTCY